MKNNTSLIYKLCLVIGDGLSVIIAFAAAYVLRISLDHKPFAHHIYAQDYITTLVSLLPFWIAIFAVLNLYSEKVYENRFSELGRLFTGSFIGLLFVISYSYITNIQIFPAHLVTVYSMFFIFLLVLLFRTIIRGTRRELFSYGIGINNVLIVGNNKASDRLISAIEDTKITGYKILGIVGKSSKTNYPSFKDFESAIEHLKTKRLDTIFQTESLNTNQSNDYVLTYAQENHVNYRFVPGNSELFVGKIEVDLFGTMPVIAVHQTSLIGWGQVVKRLSDVVFGGLILIIASPLMLVIALIIKLSDGGSILFRQKRLTRFGTTATILKFRSMKTKYSGMTPEEAFKKMGRPELAIEYRKNNDHIDNDPRLSRIGKFIRIYSLDELPQLINVVKGDISLVGPRALVPYELDQYDKKNLILSVKSGLTGLPQISGVADLSFEERRKLDLYYVQNWSFWGDMVIMAKTFSVVIFHKGKD